MIFEPLARPTVNIAMVEIPAFRTLFGRSRPLIGVIHLPPLPGSPRFQGDLKAITDRVRRDARSLRQGGASGMILENFGDAPFHPERVEPATVALMTTFALVAREASDLPLGINVLRNDAEAALAVALAGGGAFIRVNVHVGAMLTDQGIIQGRAHETLRLRERLGAEVAVFADLQVKHAAPLVPRAIEEEAEEAARRGLADALILTGSMTGKAVNFSHLEAVKQRMPSVPLLAGSGGTLNNVRKIFPFADGLIVGTALKIGGRVEAPVDPEAVRKLVAAIESTAPGAGKQ